MNELTTPVKMEFVGHSNEKSKLEKINSRFTIEVSREEFKRIRQFPFPSLMTAKILDSKSTHHVSGEIKQLVNPFKEFHDSMSPTFMRIFDY